MRRSPREARRERATLRALTSSALALFGAAGKASADTAIDHVQTSYSFSTYSEDDLDSAKTVPATPTSKPNLQRYEISTQQVSLAAPITEWMDFSQGLTHEKMSGGSPWFSAPDAAGAPVQIMSKATIQDTRNDANLHVNYYTEEGRMGLGGGYSKENDYTAMSGGFDG